MSFSLRFGFSSCRSSSIEAKIVSSALATPITRSFVLNPSHAGAIPAPFGEASNCTQMNLENASVMMMAYFCTKPWAAAPRWLAVASFVR